MASRRLRRFDPWTGNYEEGHATLSRRTALRSVFCAVGLMRLLRGRNLAVLV
ncbi:MAG: hypothetical protein WCF33_13485 [Pseudonocardiaceae bacterium]